MMSEDKMCRNNLPWQFYLCCRHARSNLWGRGCSDRRDSSCQGFHDGQRQLTTRVGGECWTGIPTSVELIIRWRCTLWHLWKFVSSPASSALPSLEIWSVWYTCSAFTLVWLRSLNLHVLPDGDMGMDMGRGLLSVGRSFCHRHVHARACVTVWQAHEWRSHRQRLKKVSESFEVNTYRLMHDMFDKVYLDITWI